ncbi:MAG: dipeptidase [Chitinophagaceae bacterium]|jgi:membrane dipeptidase|nr:dipeptidase [Chitinophagaceae bacterium]MCA6469105.1 dipeptidase [Chitinophagaceae bacterium]MCA6476731.1 dipeptidase [Chitinophagaceae bacterium]MCA6480250.1 dipeptidase [Chitinophagaceae bacterium]MCA6492778.1 dipeptidase [Chitinophagaceae bacterium]
MKRILPLLLLPLLAQTQSVQKLHKKAIVVDSHNDIITACIEKNVRMDQDLRGKTHSDLQRMKEGGLDVQIFSVWCDGEKPAPFQFANREMDLLDEVIKNNPDKIALTRTTAEMEQAVKEKKIAALFGVEGGHMIENSLEKLDQIFSRGARYMTLTWNNSTDWATSAWDETYKKDSLAKTHKGLTDFGREVVKRMNRLGMMVDLSHVGEQTFWDAIATTRSPVIVSHSNAWSICPVPRNLKDDQILAVGKNGGVIALNFYSGFVDSTYKKKEALFQKAHRKEIDSLIASGVQTEYALTLITEKYAAEANEARPSLEQLLAHLDHIVRLIGPDYVGIGSDFDGISSSPKGLDDVTSYPLLTDALLKRGFTKKQITNILGGNIIRVWKANEAGAGK